MIEQQIRLDLELALAQIRTTIQADCHLVKLAFNHDAQTFGGVVLAGEKFGLKQWQYTEGYFAARIDVQAIKLDFTGDTLRYLKEDQNAIENYWMGFTDDLINFFFNVNPDYREAIS